jgi:flagellar motor component MotA
MDPTKIINAWITSLVRMVLALAGGILIRKGYVDSSLWESTVGVIVGGAITAFWSLYEKYHVKKTVLTALAMPTNSTPAQLQVRVANDPVTQ